MAHIILKPNVKPEDLNLKYHVIYKRNGKTIIRSKPNSSPLESQVEIFRLLGIEMPKRIKIPISKEE